MLPDSRAWGQVCRADSGAHGEVCCACQWGTGRDLLLDGGPQGDICCLTVGHRARFVVPDSGTHGLNPAILDKFEDRSFIHSRNIEGS